MYEYPLDKETFEKLKELVTSDTYLLSPEIGVRYNSIHQGLNKSNYPISNSVDFHFDIATRYCEDKEYARAYALTPYECGIAIFCQKNSDFYTILVLGEDDGAWYISRFEKFDWISGKYRFISLVSEALSIFNNNYRSE